MKNKLLFSRSLISAANARLAAGNGKPTSALPREVAAILSEGRKTTEELRVAFVSASLRLRKA